MFIYIATIIIASIIVLKESPTTFKECAWAGARTVCYTLTLILLLNAFIITAIPMRTTEVIYHETTNKTVNNANGEQTCFFYTDNGELRAVSIDKSNIRQEEWANKPILVEIHQEYKNFCIKFMLLKQFQSKTEYEVIENSLN